MEYWRIISGILEDYKWNIGGLLVKYWRIISGILEDY